MQKKQVFEIAGSNIEQLGSDVERKCKEASAAGEPAWKGAGQKAGLLKWRIEQFKVKKSQQPVEEFFSGDSYILLNTYEDKKSGKLLHDLHFWLGGSTSADEAGTAAYKTVELDTLLGDDPVQHREVEGHESSLFLGYFKEQGGVRILEGGVDSGFNPVKPEEYRSRLLWVKGRKNVRVVEVPMKASSLNSGDVFVLDEGLTLTQFNGKQSGVAERHRAAVLCRALDDERRGKPTVSVVEEGDADAAEFFTKIGGSAADVQSADVAGDAAWEAEAPSKRIYRLSDGEDGKEMEFTKVCEGKLDKDALNSSDVFIVDVGPEIIAWIGKDSSKGERSKAMTFAQTYITKYERPAYLPISKVLEGGENEFFNSFFQ